MERIGLPAAPSGINLTPAEVTQRPALDVCVTHYNLGAYLPYLLESLDLQTNQDFELYVVDDGSTDIFRVIALSKCKKGISAHTGTSCRSRTPA